jgi:molybdopterin synthase sulfur carrier subunit
VVVTSASALGQNGAERAQDEPARRTREVETDVADVTVRYWAGARAAAGVDEERLEASSVHEIVAGLSRRSSELAGVLALSSLLVDGLVVRTDASLTDGQTLEVLPPFAGG